MVSSTADQRIFADPAVKARVLLKFCTASPITLLPKTTHAQGDEPVALTANFAYLDLLPVHLLESARAVPAHLSPDRKSLHIGFADRLDHTLLYAVGVMLGCDTLACVVPESAVARVLDSLRQSANGRETYFETIRDPREVTRTICSYTSELGASALSIARVAGYLWIRCHRGSANRDLLFRVVSGEAAGPRQVAAQLAQECSR